MHPGIKLLDAATATNGAPVAVKATGTVTAVPGADLVDGETFTLSDGAYTVVFEFDDDASVVETDVLRAVAFDGADTDAEVATAIAAAINGSNLRMSALAASEVVTMTMDVAGPEGNILAVADGVADVDFVVTAFTSGALSGFSLRKQTPGTEYAWDGRNIGLVHAQSVAGSGTMNVTIRLHGYKGTSQAWYPMGTSTTESDRGLLNGGAIDEDGADNLMSATLVQGLSAFDRIYAQVVAINGTDTAVDCWLEVAVV